MAIRNVQAVERDDGLFSVTFYVNHDFHQLFMTRETFEKVVGDDVNRLVEYLHSLFN